MSEYPLVNNLVSIEKENVLDLNLRLEKVMNVLRECEKANESMYSHKMRFDVARSVFYGTEKEFLKMIVIEEMKEDLIATKECVDEIGMNSVAANLIVALLINNDYAITNEDFINLMNEIFKEDADNILDETFKKFESRIKSTLMKNVDSKSSVERQAKYFKEEYKNELLSPIVQKVINEVTQFAKVINNDK